MMYVIQCGVVDDAWDIFYGMIEYFYMYDIKEYGVEDIDDGYIRVYMEVDY